MKAIREDVLHRAFTDMWNKLYTNQGTILEPLLKGLTELVAARQDSEEIRQLDKEIKDISGQSQILNQVMRKGIYGLCSFYGEQQQAWLAADGMQEKKDTFDQKAAEDKRNRADRTAYPTDRRTGRIKGGVRRATVQK